MQTCYTLRMPDGYSIAILDLSKVRGRVYEVNRINVPERHRGRRYGTALLREACTDADRCCVLLRLVPLESGGLSTTELEAWYTRHGFVQRSNGYFYREPLAQVEA